jgi:NAD(P)-dependent dehydrogenase (short-subunit alcohol dehydrogenase family)
MKNVLITGAGRGIGLALTKEFTQHGDRVLGTYRNDAHAKELRQMNVIAVKADVTDEKSFTSLKSEIKKLGHIDILINNSGVIGSESASLLELNIDEVAEVIAVNSLGPMRICQLVLPFMAKSGTIVQITSQMGSIQDNGSGGYYDYRMSKAALNMFNKSLSKEFPHLTCLALHPGWVKTDMGGAGAAITPEESARGLFEVIVKSKPSQSGQFFNFRGQSLPW